VQKIRRKNPEICPSPAMLCSGHNRICKYSNFSLKTKSWLVPKHARTAFRPIDAVDEVPTSRAMDLVFITDAVGEQYVELTT
jgi:hypothetical protein